MPSIEPSERSRRPSARRDGRLHRSPGGRPRCRGDACGGLVVDHADRLDHDLCPHPAAPLSLLGIDAIRQSPGSTSGTSPSRPASFAQRPANQPVSYISTWSPGGLRIPGAASRGAGSRRGIDDHRLPGSEDGPDAGKHVTARRRRTPGRDDRSSAGRSPPARRAAYWSAQGSCRKCRPGRKASHGAAGAGVSAVAGAVSDLARTAVTIVIAPRMNREP